MRIPVLAALITPLLLWLSGSFVPQSTASDGKLLVAFLDVGQGDSIFIESPDGTQVLIDGGKGSTVLSRLHEMMGFFDRDLDMVLATHPDLDHIGGLIDVLARYKVATIVMTENKGDTPAYDALQDAIKAEGAQVIIARAGQVYDLGSGAVGSTTLSVLFPDYDPSDLESNMSSIVARLAYGRTSYMLTGDSPSQIEEYLVRRDGTKLKSDVLKLGHHGSDTSSSDAFLTAVDPMAAIISAGKNNTYGHPHKAVLDRLYTHDITYENTADVGSIVTVSDGTDIVFR
jgi:competence protein ComEC